MLCNEAEKEQAIVFVIADNVTLAWKNRNSRGKSNKAKVIPHRANQELEIWFTVMTTDSKQPLFIFNIFDHCCY